MFLRVFLLIKISHLNGKFKFPRNPLISINRITVKQQHTIYLGEKRYVLLFFLLISSQMILKLLYVVLLTIHQSEGSFSQRLITQLFHSSKSIFDQTQVRL